MSDTVGIGVDLCRIDRIEKAIQKEHFNRRVYTEREIAYFMGRGRQAAQSAAAMYAAKEAVAKALGTGFAGGIMPEQIEVVHTESGAPGIVLHGEAETALSRLGGGRIHLSLSHEDNMATAFVVIDRAS
ncbi:MAG: holo-ACP synthase [Clostridia bacterium]|nr:holo-ACP synthase [Clostridia bacterium]